MHGCFQRGWRALVERWKAKIRAHDKHLAALCQSRFCKKSSYMIANILLYCERSAATAKLLAGLVLSSSL